MMKNQHLDGVSIIFMKERNLASHRMLQVSQRLTFAVLNQNCRFGIQCLAPILCHGPAEFLISCLVVRQMLTVVGSGSSKNEVIASPIVTRVGLRNFCQVRSMTVAFVALAKITMIIIVRLKLSLHSSSTSCTKQ